ncbi:MAG: YihY/virulence factor BrkB family protein, partial [Ketobacteraceae bacterium]|nr:YihY/virulence factor BrkB family protein [Ketobacteraceae bacterium]
MEKPRRYLNRFQDLIEQDTDNFSGIQKSLILMGRGVYALWRDISHGQLTLRAMSLSFTTLLSLVPMLALSFSVLKGFGIHNSMEPLLMEYLAPLGDKGVEMTEKILDFVNNMNVGVLGFMGLGLLVYTVVSLVQKIEEAFNYIWSVKESRGFSERFRDYLSAVLIGPFIMMVAFGLSASVKNSSFVQYLLDIQTVGIFILMMINLIPFFMVIGAFTFIYSFMPNTRVQTKAALLGAIVS